MKNISDKILNWYFSKKLLPHWCVLMLDCAIVGFAGVFVFWMFTKPIFFAFNFERALHSVILFMLLSVVGFKLFHIYSSVVRYSSFVDLMKVAYGNLLNMVLAIGVSQWIYYCHIGYFHYFFIRHVITIFIIATLLMWGMRIVIKKLYEMVSEDSKAMQTLIFGSMEGGVALAKSIRSQRPAKFNLRGFISHDGSFKNHIIMGVNVYEANEKLEVVIKKEAIKAVLVSPLRINSFQNNESLQDMFINAGVKIYMANNLKEWKAGDDMTDVQLKEVSVEDLLPRDEIKIDMASVGQELTGKRVLITGAAGSIGSEMVRQVAVYKPAAMMLIDQAETPEHDVRLMMSKEFPEIEAKTVVTSICKADRMERLFAEFKPDYVFHAAAYKHVPMMEDNPSEAVQNNIYGTKVIADLSVKYGVKKFVMVSTDKAVNPTNVMGCSKRICEIYTQALSKVCNTQFVTTRFGNVLGSNGSVIPLFKKQIKEGGPVTVTDPDIIRYFMLIPEACKLVLEAGTKGHGGEIFVFDMGKPVKIVDLAKRMIQLSNAKNVEIKFTGLRPGEKLFEEVLNEQENSKPSFHEKIRIAEVREYDYEKVSKQIDDLIEISKNYDDMAIVKKMKEIVPEYISKNSKYEELDKKTNIK
ncbi:MAG: polysaccharide biosynthesis protein [Bacteroidaceae bacterium]|nr:polysaccharide biosynthesis protein [Bacteroidaceae bacterium]